MPSLKSLLLAAALTLGVLATPSAVEPVPANLLGDVINALSLGLVTDTNVFITLDTLTTNLVTINFDAKNVLPFELTIDTINATAGLNGTVYSAFTHDFAAHPVVVPGFGGTKNSGNLTNVRGVPRYHPGRLDGCQGNLWLMQNESALTVFGLGGVPLSITGLKQANVPTTWVWSLVDICPR
ncbi:hypothetical protein MKEN_01466600 [Mycena kentingensis (nom. inval.)]|nr:hypothetical protein MKEN_01466600 [Mycena kentingensis (nom. inval.)]